MSGEIFCPNPDCGAPFSVDGGNLGNLGRCKACGTMFPIVPPTQDGGQRPWSTDLDSAPKPTALALPEQFGRYKILRLLGGGGMGSVYLAFDPQLKRKVALKVPHREFAQNPGIRERFLREARAAARFHDPDFCSIYEIGEIDGLPYLTMAYIEGKTLADSIDRGRGWPPRRAAKVARELAIALTKLHGQGIVHRDLKPANIMVNMVNDLPELVIMDFGLARMASVEDAPLTQPGNVLGTALYMAPEQAAGDTAAIGPVSDVYSLGVILYELLTGVRPFEGPWSMVIGLKLVKDPDPPSKHRPDLSTDLDAICLKAIAKKPEDRYDSMSGFARALKAWLDKDRAPKPVAKPKEPVPPEPPTEGRPKVDPSESGKEVPPPPRGP